jgi:hypothetical protein
MENQKLSTELTYNVINGLTGEAINKEPLTEEAAHALSKQLQESNATLPLIIRSNRAILME